MANYELSVILPVLFAISYYVSLIYTIRVDIFSEHGGIKLFMLLATLWMMIIPINMAIEFNTSNTGPADIDSNLQTLYQVMSYINYFISFYLLIWFIISMLKKMNKAKTGDAK